ncbi:BTAD domain-containing putative transcriptional regulator [Nonomuraea thailandensis]
MLALHGCGRQAEALTAFEEARRALSEELGVDPGEGLRRAHHLVLAGSAERAAPDPVVPRQLPRDLMVFVGRAREAVRLKSLLDPWGDGPPHPFVVICGAPGVGKSTLAVRVAHAVRERFPDGQLYVNLRGGTPNVSRLSSHEIFSRLLRGIGTQDDAVPRTRTRPRPCGGAGSRAGGCWCSWTTPPISPRSGRSSRGRSAPPSW